MIRKVITIVLFSLALIGCEKESYFDISNINIANHDSLNGYYDSTYAYQSMLDSIFAWKLTNDSIENYHNNIFNVYSVIITSSEPTVYNGVYYGHKYFCINLSAQELVQHKTRTYETYLRVSGKYKLVGSHQVSLHTTINLHGDMVVYWGNRYYTFDHASQYWKIYTGYSNINTTIHIKK